MFQDLDSTLTKILNDPAMNAPPLAELLGTEISFLTPEQVESCDGRKAHRDL